MTPEFALRNLGLYSLQIVILTAIAGLLPWAFKLRAPRPQLAFWYAVLAICIVLPVAQPWAQTPVQAASEVSITTSPFSLAGDAAADHGFFWRLGWAATALLLVAVGTVVRLALLALGLLRLNRMRARAERVAGVPSIEHAIAATGSAAEFLCSDEIAGPVTFGVRNPAVLVPPGFFDLEPIEQQSVAIHELLHVRRRDWLYTLAEECVRAMLWFHPAIWFLLNRVQLTREQSVDQAVVQCTRRSDEYVGALLKIAAARIEPDLAPAPLFLKKRHLRERVAAIVQGVSMSKGRLTVTMIAVLAVLPVVAGILAWQIPLQAAPQEVRDASGVEVRTGYFKVLHRTPVEYPAEARRNGLSGDVVVAVSVNAEGEVTDAKVVSGAPALRKAVLESVLNWHFAVDPAAGAQPLEVAVRFTPPAGGGVESGPAVLPGGDFTVDRIDLSRLPNSLREKVEAAMPVRSGELVARDRFPEIERSLMAVDSHLTLSTSIRGDKNDLHASFVVTLPQGNAAVLGPQRIRVGGNVQAANLLKKVTPTYPVEAKAAGVQGTVRMQAVIAKDGTIQTLDLISGPPELVPSAMETVKQWVYKPTLLNGNQVEVVTQIDVNYTLLP